MADPPIYLPWLILAACVVVLAWSFWPHKPGDEPLSTPATGPIANGGGDNAQAFAIGQARDVYLNAGARAPAEPPPEPDPHVSRGLGSLYGDPDPEPDYYLKQVYARLIMRLAPVPEGAEAKKRFFERINLEIADKVHLKKMWVWGRRGTVAAKRIPAATLDNATFDGKEGKLRIPSIDSLNATVYHDVKFNREQVEAVWASPLSRDNVERVPASAGFAFNVLGRWGATVNEALARLSSGYEYDAKLRAFEQGAYEEHFQVWGRETSSGQSPSALETPVPASHWETHRLNSMRCGHDDFQTEPRLSRDAGQPFYTALRVSKSEFERNATDA